MRLGRTAAIFGGLLCAALASAQPARPDASGAEGAGPAHQLIATVITRDDRGRVFCSIWRGPEGYPTERRTNVGQALDRTIVNRRAVCVFDDVTPGEYALAAFHDENANNDLDRNFLGIPSEGTGASNDAHNMFGPPSYDDARFLYPAGARVHRIRLSIHY